MKSCRITATFQYVTNLLNTQENVERTPGITVRSGVKAGAGPKQTTQGPNQDPQQNTPLGRGARS
jgi:hypothetical protein